MDDTGLNLGLVFAGLLAMFIVGIAMTQHRNKPTHAKNDVVRRREVKVTDLHLNKRNNKIEWWGAPPTPMGPRVANGKAGNIINVRYRINR